MDLDKIVLAEVNLSNVGSF